jgi:hypothetical protein
LYIDPFPLEQLSSTQSRVAQPIQQVGMPQVQVGSRQP